MIIGLLLLSVPESVSWVGECPKYEFQILLALLVFLLPLITHQPGFSEFAVCDLVNWVSELTVPRWFLPRFLVEPDCTQITFGHHLGHRSKRAYSMMRIRNPRGVAVTATIPPESRSILTDRVSRRFAAAGCRLFSTSNSPNG